MFSDTPSPPLSLSITPTQSWTQDSTIDVDDAPHQTQSQSDAPGSSTVFEEKKWMVTEVAGGSGTSFSFVRVAHRLLKDSPPSLKSGEFLLLNPSLCSWRFHFSLSHKQTTLSRRPFLRMVSTSPASFSTPTSSPIRRQREVRIVRAVVAPA